MQIDPRVNRFKAKALLRADKRRRNSAPFARVKGIRRDGDLLSYEHPTKGGRSRRWPKALPTFASKFDMINRVFYNIGRVKAMQVQAGIAPLNYDDVG